MTFDESNIGKLVQTNSCDISPVGSGEVPEFAFIVGYNYFEHQYIVSDSPYCSNSTESVSASKATYSTDEVIAILDKYSDYLRNINVAITSGEKKYRKVWNETTRGNHYMELSHLSNAYHETYSRLSHVEFCINVYDGSCDDYWSLRQKVLKKEERELQKALRRLHKRFVFFFGENAYAIEEAIQKKGGSLICNDSDAMQKILLSFKHLEGTKEYIIHISQNLPKIN